MKNQKGFSWQQAGFVPIIIILVVLIGFIGVYFFKTRKTISIAQPVPNFITNPITDSKILEIKYSGGLCPDEKICTTDITIMSDGSILENNILKTRKDITKLDVLVRSTNFDLIKSKKFTGTCPTAYDGQEAIFVFYLANSTQNISSCEFDLDFNSPLFAEINKILN